MQPLRSRSRPGRRLLGLFVVCVAFGVAGCSGGSEKLHPVSGKVTVGGQSLTGGVVTLFDEKGIGQASGMIGADGTYTPTTNGKKGVPAGKYAVGVSTMVPPGADATTSTPLPKAGSGVNPRYMNPQSSGLTITVPNTDPGGYDLKLIK